ncbi:MAG: class I SAM-dependent methyltransferase [Deltaproteobacteria bacterium]|nr:class I SAM-dependent methyltransferase [Deltaproteobacteria bacterium]
MIDYNTAAKTYDNSRAGYRTTIDEFANKIDLNNRNILDFGCGTGNYLRILSDSFNSSLYGVEPSEGMREIAKGKNPSLEIREGNHTQIPFEDNYFDFIYMTDVIHHIPDLNILFNELKRVLNNTGSICISTESWKQIESRWYNSYFCSLVQNEKGRYPDIQFISEKGEQAGLITDEVQVLKSDTGHIVSDKFINHVKEMNFSMFRMISSEELNKGIELLKKDIGKEFTPEESGETLIWFKKFSNGKTGNIQNEG